MQFHVDMMMRHHDDATNEWSEETHEQRMLHRGDELGVVLSVARILEDAKNVDPWYIIDSVVITPVRD